MQIASAVEMGGSWVTHRLGLEGKVAHSLFLDEEDLLVSDGPLIGQCR